MLLFIIASGLSLVFGLMNITNLAHGSFYLVGAYVGLSVLNATNSFWLALLAAPLAVIIIGLIVQRLLLNRFHNQELPQVLLTFGIMYILADLSLMIWGGTPQSLQKPALFSSSMQVAGFYFPTYRLFVMAVGPAVAVFLWLFLERTRVGAMVRAGVDDPEMARGVGVNLPLLFSLVFCLGVSLAALAGVLGGPIFGVSPGLDLEILLLALVVVVIGGLGSLRGAFVGGLLVGLLDTFGRALFPEFAAFAIFVPMAIVLGLRPKGLFGR
jgi:branched-chain amino acid transport system permease protein